MGFPRQEYWSGLPFPFPGDLPDPGLEAGCPALAGGFFTLSHLELHSYTLYLLISHSLQSSQDAICPPEPGGVGSLVSSGLPHQTVCVPQVLALSTVSLRVCCGLPCPEKM